MTLCYRVGTKEDCLSTTEEDLTTMFEAKAGFRSGFVSLLGFTNAGKSTLINRFVTGAPAIVSKHPQTTRVHQRCISTNDQRQIVFVDTPGWLERKGLMDKIIRKEINRGLAGSDVYLHVIDARRPDPERNLQLSRRLLRKCSSPVVVALNKVDGMARAKVLPMLTELFETLKPVEIVPVSAHRGSNFDELDRVLSRLLPEGPMLYPVDMRVDQPRDMLFSEFIREQVFLLTYEEVPFSCAVEVTKVSGRKPMEVHATIFVERESQKGILVGEGGKAVGRIRRLANDRAAAFVGKPVAVHLHVKVSKDWKKDARRLREFGYALED